MIRFLRVAILCCFGVMFISLAPSQERNKYSINTTDAAVPKDVSSEIANLFADGSTQLLDATGKPICDVWLRKEIPADATEAQLKTGVTFREVKQSEILGAIQFH